MNYFHGWWDSGVFDRMMDGLRGLARTKAGRGSAPTAALVDSQSVKTEAVLGAMMAARRSMAVSGISGFTVLRRRRVVERSFAWMGRCRRLAKDVERTLARSVAWAKLAACRFMMRRVARCRNAGNSAKIATI